MNPTNESKRAISVNTKKRALSSLIHYLIGFRVFKAYGVKLAIIT
jgi:hypothetical protein